MSRRPGARTASTPAQPFTRALGARPVRRGAATLAVAALLSAPALTACASGNDAMTNLARTTTNAAQGSVGSINLNNVYVAGPVSAGGDAQVISAFENVSGQADQLVSISSPDASGGALPGSAAIPASGQQIYIANGSAPTLTGVKRDLGVGNATKITFTFAKSGSVTLDVPVEKPQPGASAAPSVTVAPTTAAAATASASATSSAAASAGTTPTTAASATPTS